MKRIFFRYEANKTGFISLFRIEANRRILHAKRIAEANIPFLANIFKKNWILIETKVLWKALLNNLKQYVAIIRQYEKILSEYSLQHVFFASNQIFVFESVRTF